MEFTVISRFYSEVSCKDSDGFSSLKDMIDMRYTILQKNENVHLIVGPHCSEGGRFLIQEIPKIQCAGMIPVAQLAVKYNLPIIGYESVASDMLTLRSTRFATLSRVGQYGSQLGMMQTLVWVNKQGTRGS
jgi:hypothetical protein